MSLAKIARFPFPFHSLPLVAALMLFAALSLPAAEAVKKVDFETQVLPILKRNCLACHDGDDAEADLILETPKTILKGSEDGPVVVPKHSERSKLLSTAAQERKPFMPPKNNRMGAVPLLPEELAILKAWIDQGATGTVNAKPKPLVWHPLPAGLHPILALAVSGDGQFAACGRANQIFVYHIATGQVVARLTDPKLVEPTGRNGYRTSAQRDYVQSLAFSADGMTLASGEYRMVKLWQRQPGAPQMSVGKEAASAVAVSTDGKWLATADKDNVIHLWDAATAKEVKALQGHLAAVTSLRFSPDNTKLASGSADKTARVWDIAGGKVFAQLEVPGEISAVAWLLAGKRLATAGGDNLLRIWDVPAKEGEAFKSVKEFNGHTQPVTCLATSSDGKQLVSGSSDGSVRHWAVEQNRQARQMDHGAPVTAVAVSPNGKTFASAGGNVAKLWNPERGTLISELKGDHGARMKLADAERASLSAKTEVAYWKTALEEATKEQTTKADAVKKAGDGIKTADKALADAKAALAKITDDKIKPAAQEVVTKAESAKASAEKALAAAQVAVKQGDQTLVDAKASAAKAATAQTKADADAAAAKQALPASEAPVRAVAFATDGLSVATAGDDQTIRTWNLEGIPCDSYPNKSGPVLALISTTEGRIIASVKDKAPVVWSAAQNWTLARTIGTGDEKSPIVNRVLSLAFSSDGKRLVTGGGSPSRSGELKIWNTADGTLVREIKPSHSDTVVSLALSPDGKSIATASSDKFVKVFDFTTGKLIKSLAGHTHYVLGVSWRPDGRMLASSGMDKAVKLWSWPAGEMVKSNEGYSNEVTSVRYLGVEGQLLTSAADPRVRSLKPDGTNLKDFTGMKGFMFTAAATPDGRTILGGGQDSVLRVWNAETGKSLFNLEPPKAEVDVVVKK